MNALALKFALALAAITPQHQHVRDEIRHHRSHPIRCTRHAVASVYGPGDSGSRTASGATLTWTLRAVAHKTYRLHKRITFCFRGRHLTVPILDRGPYVAGRDFDLTIGAARALRFPVGVGGIEWRFGP